MPLSNHDVMGYEERIRLDTNLRLTYGLLNRWYAISNFYRSTQTLFSLDLIGIRVNDLVFKQTYHYEMSLNIIIQFHKEKKEPGKNEVVKCNTL